MCTVLSEHGLPIAPSTYYEHVNRGPSSRMLRDATVIESLPGIRVPSLIVVGADDTPFLQSAEVMAAKIAGSQKVVIPAAGHVANIDQPQAFNDAVLAFLNTLPA